MGCKPSKRSQVATGNIVSSRKLQKKQSNVSKKETSETSNKVSNLLPNKSEKENLVENVEVKEVQLSDASEEGKLITIDSPDRYFSSRKDEDIVEEVLASVEYLSETKCVPVDEDGDEERGEDDEGESSSNDSADLKETILMEENGSKAMTAE